MKTVAPMANSSSDAPRSPFLSRLADTIASTCCKLVDVLHRHAWADVDLQRDGRDAGQLAEVEDGLVLVANHSGRDDLRAAARPLLDVEVGAGESVEYGRPRACARRVGEGREALGLRDVRRVELARGGVARRRARGLRQRRA